MSHIFFERLEQRRSTQSLSFGTSGFFDYGSSFGGISTPSSSFSSAYTPFGSSSFTLGYPPGGGWPPIDPGPTCYYGCYNISLPQPGDGPKELPPIWRPGDVPIWTQPIPGDGKKKLPGDWIIWSPSKFPPIYDPRPPLQTCYYCADLPWRDIFRGEGGSQMTGQLWQIPLTSTPAWSPLDNLFSPMLGFPQTPSYLAPTWTSPGTSFSPMGQTWQAPSYQPSLWDMYTDKAMSTNSGWQLSCCG